MVRIGEGSLRWIVGVVLLVLGICALPSRAYGEIVGIEFLEWKQDMTGTLQIEGGGLPGTEADLQSTLGLPEGDYLTQERLWLHWLKNNYLIGTHLDSKRSATETLTSPLVFGGVVFAPGETVKSRLELRQDSLLYLYTFINIPMFRLGIPFGAERLNFSTSVESTTTGMEGEGSEGGTFPVVGLAFSFQPLPILHISAEGEGMKYQTSGNEFRFYDLRGQVEIHFAPFIGMNFGYRKCVTDADLEGFGVADLTMKGPYATLNFSF
ncbi:MAG: hypothetical protein L0Z52_13120 [Acidobacteria bacterium]|nr:hypothetical protein [Acidobacteriota bacterium]